MSIVREGARTVRAVLAAASVIAACAGGHAAQRHPGETQPQGRRLFEVPGHGALEIAVPAGWIASAGDEDPSAIRLEPPGGSFVALLAIRWNRSEQASAADRVAEARIVAELARRQALETSGEKEIPLHEIAGEGVHGFWFAATDRALAAREPGADEWRHLLQGVAAVGPLSVAFTLLDNAPGPQRDAILGVVLGARYVPAAEANGGEPAGAGGFVLDDDAFTSPLRVALANRAWSVLVDLPDFRMFEPRANDGGLLVLGQDPRTALVASVLLRPAGDAGDAGACRDHALARIRSAAPDIEDLRTWAAAPAARAAYTLAEMRGRPIRQMHAHAWLLRDGVCVNVHASKAEPAAGDAERIEAILASVRFGEDR